MTAELKLIDVYLKYQVLDAQNRSLKQTLLNKMVGGNINRVHDKVSEISSLNGINLDLKKGTRLAVLGHNGSGKTTLLRCMGGIFAPTSGQVIRKGQFEVLIDPYAGLNHEATGRHNIYNIAYARGYSKKLIETIEDKVIEFSEIGPYIDFPIRTFSLGMVSRLTFSVISHLNAEVLLIDEGIGAGDQQFQEKAAAQFKNFLDKTQILVLATHSIDLAKLYCNEFIKLERGFIVESGTL